MTRRTGLPALPQLPTSVDPKLRPILAAIKEALEVQIGHRGEDVDKAVTFRDLIDSGIVSLPSGAIAGGGTILPITNPGDLTTPPVPRNLAANGTFTNVILSWDGGFRHPLVAATEVFRHTSDDLTAAAHIGSTPAHIYVDTVEPGTTHFYWVRFRSPADVAGPYNGTAGTSATTSKKVSDLLTDLNDAIGQTHLSTVLSTEIDAIQINGNNITAEVADRIAAISGEAASRATAISGEAATRLADINAEILARTTGDGVLQGNIDTVSATVTTQGTNITGNANAVGALVIRVTDNEGDISTNATDITALETTVNNPTTGVAASASGLTALETTVTTQGSDISTNATDITALETTVNNPNSGVAASASGLNTLSTTVTTQGSEITAQATDITTLNTTVGDHSSSIATHTLSIAGISAENYVKVDVNGNVAGYGIYGSSTSSEFAVNAGVFKIADGSSSVQPFAVITGAGLTVALNGTQYTNTTQAWQQSNHPTGRWFAAGTYIDTALIAEASIDAAKIHNLTVDFANVTGTLTASQVSAITVTGSMIAASQTIVSPTIYGGTITAGTSLTSPVINGGTITGALVLSGSTGLITEAGGSHYGYNTAVTMDVTATSTAATTQAQGNIKPYNYQYTTPPSPALKSPASNLWRYRRQNVSPDLSGSVYITNVGGLINSNGNSTQTHCTVTIKLREKVSGTVRSTKAFNINSFNSGDDATKTLTLTGSNGGYSYTLIHQYRTETGSDGHTTYYYHRMVPHTMTFTATPTGTVAFNDSTSTGMVAEVVISNIATAYASVGNRTIRIQDTAVNDY